MVAAVLLCGERASANQKWENGQTVKSDETFGFKRQNLNDTTRANASMLWTRPRCAPIMISSIKCKQ